MEGNATAQISADRHTAFDIVGVDGETPERVAIARQLKSELAAASDSGVEVMITGFAPAQADLIDVETTDMQRAEAIGLPVATAVPVLALGAVVAATLPIYGYGGGHRRGRGRAIRPDRPF
ncbi:MMPL family transporter [Nocardia sp. NPDC052278]|uniref:MMPL family transporter n=1 Tax=unclassified Nocardia TaxID=2637762 RepID=UPI00368DA907